MNYYFPPKLIRKSDRFNVLGLGIKLFVTLNQGLFFSNAFILKECEICFGY